MIITKNRYQSFVVLAVLLGCVFALACEKHNSAKARTAKATVNEIRSFGEALTRYSSTDFQLPEDVNEMVSTCEVVAVGEIVAVTPGRKEFIGRGCDDRNFDPAEPGRENEVCKGNPNAALYAQYVNIVIRPDKVIKGTGDFKKPEGNLHVELPWPINVEVDGLTEKAPKGSRVIVIGDPVRDAEEQARPLEEEGIVSPNSIAPNLLRVPPYGLVLESEEGSTVAILMGNDILTRDNNEDLSQFDKAVDRIDQTIQ